MANNSMNNIKSRMKSVQGTMQLTKAMELVAASKLRRAKAQAEEARPFFGITREALCTLLSGMPAGAHPYITERPEGRTCYIVIAGDRGLAGGFNHNALRLADEAYKEGDTLIPIGKKAVEHYHRRDHVTIAQSCPETADTGVGASLLLAKTVCAGYLRGDYDRVVLIYNRFVSMLSQFPTVVPLLPLTATAAVPQGAEPLMEQSEDGEVLERITPTYLGGVIYGAVSDSLAAESAARRSAMSSANKNAAEMIDTLTLQFNRARQAIITAEITEIVSGAEALS